MQIFIKALHGEIFTFEVERSDSIDDVKLKITDQRGFPPSQQRLIYGGLKLENERTLGDYDISDSCWLHLVLKFRGGGGDPLLAVHHHFVDFENNDAMQRLPFTDDQGQMLFHLQVCPGINIEGKCTREACRLYGKRAIIPKLYHSLRITPRIGNITCGLCERSLFEVLTCGFTDCEWMYSGRKKGSQVHVTSEWQIAGDEYVRFREAGNMADWESLVITARPNPSPRPQCEMCLRDLLWGEDHRSLECGCRFHKDSVTSWKLRETQCPTCRVEMWRPNIFLEVREGPPDISMEGRETTPTISIAVSRPKPRSRMWSLLFG